jgi:SAM-dependent methyltransferase
MLHDPYLQPYRESIERHGVCFEATLWANRESQRVRFKTFTEMCGLAGKRVLDAGCSRGDFASYLIDNRVAFARYIGIDGLAEVIRHAAAQNLPGCEFHHGDLLTDESLLSRGEPDIITISGTLNTMIPREARRRRGADV